MLLAGEQKRIPILEEFVGRILKSLPKSVILHKFLKDLEVFGLF